MKYKLISEKNVIFYKVLVFLVPPENKFVKIKEQTNWCFDSGLNKL